MRRGHGALSTMNHWHLGLSPLELKELKLGYFYFGQLDNWPNFFIKREGERKDQ